MQYSLYLQYLADHKCKTPKDLLEMFEQLELVKIWHFSETMTWGAHFSKPPNETPDFTHGLLSLTTTIQPSLKQICDRWAECICWFDIELLHLSEYLCQYNILAFLFSNCMEEGWSFKLFSECSHLNPYCRSGISYHICKCSTLNFYDWHVDKNLPGK